MKPLTILTHAHNCQAARTRLTRPTIRGNLAEPYRGKETGITLAMQPNLFSIAIIGIVIPRQGRR